MRILLTKLLDFLRSFWHRRPVPQETIAELAYKTEPVIMKVNADPMDCFENVLLDEDIYTPKHV
jgi:hypothetical protein